MRESDFINQNKEKWEDFEREMKASNKDPELLSRRFIQITDDLAYARTFYKNRSVRVYLNSLAQLAHNGIYRGKRRFINSIQRFFSQEVPYISYVNRYTYFYLFLTLTASVLIGAFSTAEDESFARSILGDTYVDQSLRNIESGDPFGVYKTQDPIEMFGYIVLNNLRVSLLIFAAGLLFGLGSLILMVYNGIVLGTFIYFFYSRGLSVEFNSTVWLHGSIEILSMVVVTAAGLMFGKGLVNPGTFSRIKAFAIWGRRGAMLFLAMIPFILFAAFIESFVTRFTGLPLILKWGLIFFSIVLMLLYFVMVPLVRFGGTTDTHREEPVLSPEKLNTVDIGEVLQTGAIFTSSVQFIRIHLKKILGWMVVLSLLYLLTLVFFNYDQTIEKFNFFYMDVVSISSIFESNNLRQLLGTYKNVALFLNPDRGLFMLSAASVLQFTCFALTYRLFIRTLNIQSAKNKTSYISYLKLNNILAFSLTLAWNMILLMPGRYVFHLYLIASPFVLFGITALLSANDFRIKRSSLISMILFPYAGRKLSSLILTFLMNGLAFLFLISPLSFLVLEFMEFNVLVTEAVYQNRIRYIMSFLFIAVLCLSYFFYFVQIFHLFLTVKELETGEELRKQIKQMSTRTKNFGFESE